MKLRLYSVSDEYIDFLRADPKLSQVFDNKLGHRTHTRKYLGVALKINNFSYYILLSSPKKTDYICINGVMQIRKSNPVIIRMVSINKSTKEKELKGTLKINCMIPVPASELTPYDINAENDIAYKAIVRKEYEFISKNTDLICNSANLVYNQKKREQETILSTIESQSLPNYLKAVIPFEYAEQKEREFLSRNTKTVTEPDRQNDMVLNEKLNHIITEADKISLAVADIKAEREQEEQDEKNKKVK